MKFIIPKGKEFYCEFTVKEPGAGVPMDLTDATGTFTLSTLDIEPCVAVGPVDLTFPDPINGLAAVTLIATQTEDLISQRGFAEDGYPPMATYRAALDIETENPIYVEIPWIYVSDGGSTCPVVS